MKNIKITIVLVLLSPVLLTVKLYAQRDPVADATLQMINAHVTAQTAINSNQLSQLTTNTASATSTATTVSNTLAYLKEIEKKLQTVNAVLTTVVYVTNITTMEKDILKMQSEIASNTKKMNYLTPAELQIINQNLLVVLTTSEGLIKLTNDLLTNKTYRMGDDSRLSHFFSIKEQLAIQQNFMRATYFQYSVINEERAINASITRF